MRESLQRERGGTNAFQVYILCNTIGQSSDDVQHTSCFDDFKSCQDHHACKSVQIGVCIYE